ncbi:MAG: HEPN domain-containing protein, partial [Kiritimatiellota bacterium]|nr:HEPN domain-containing protein [Kiritimatiellota bacterium]
MTDTHIQWSEQAEYDLATAGDMLKAGRLYYVLFCCQQAVEKMLKAIYARKLEDVPPRTHQLVRMAEETKLELSEEHKDFLRELSAYYIQSRYPDEMEDMADGVSVDLAKQVLGRTEELIRWLRS